MSDRTETPCLIIDTDKMNRNIEAMAELAKRHQVNLRPHAKTHKIPRIAQLQLQAGAVGITVAKVSEAEVMAEHGISNIFIAYPLVTADKIERAVRLSERIELIIGVDSLEGAMRVEETAARLDHVLQVRLEVDTGLRRTGVRYEEAPALAAKIGGFKHLRLTGIYTYRGPILSGKPTLDIRAAGAEEGNLMVELAERIRAAGIPITDVSVGSSPTAAAVAAVEGITEIRPGTYVFYDRMQARYGVCGLEDCAGSLEVTVVSRPSPDLAVIDGGSKTFATDVQPNTEPLRLQGFGHVLELEDALLERMTEEHGMLRLGPAAQAADPHIGDRLHIIPNHICSTVNLHNRVILRSGGRLEAVPVLGRGMLE